MWLVNHIDVNTTKKHYSQQDYAYIHYMVTVQQVSMNVNEHFNEAILLWSFTSVLHVCCGHGHNSKRNWNHAQNNKIVIRWNGKSKTNYNCCNKISMSHLTSSLPLVTIHHVFSALKKNEWNKAPQVVTILQRLFKA